MPTVSEIGVASFFFYFKKKSNMSRPSKISLDEISISELFITTLLWYRHLAKKWVYLLLISLTGGIIGFFFAKSQPILFTAKLTFIIEDVKSGSNNLGGLASLAGQFGVDVGGAGSGSLISGDNILIYFKSPSLSKDVLLSRVDSTTEMTFADKYMEVYGFNEILANKTKGNKFFFKDFSSNDPNLRLKDSLLQILSSSILSNQFNVVRIDKKSSFIEVSTKMKDESLSKFYCERIVKLAIDKYINIKIQRQKSTVERLQSRADSIALLLSKKTYVGAQIQNLSNTMDINPLLKTNTNVTLETTMRDKSLLATIFASVTQNLELAKFTLSQETPVIQIIDYPIAPLNKERVSKIKTSFLSFFGCLFLGVLFFICRKIYLERKFDFNNKNNFN